MVPAETNPEPPKGDMYRCDVCDKVTQPGTKVNRIADGYRIRRYRERNKANLVHVSYKKKPVLRDDPGGVGYEWKGMLRACNSCYTQFVEEEREERLASVAERVEAKEAALVAK